MAASHQSMTRNNDEIGLRPNRVLVADEVEVECIILRPTFTQVYGSGQE